MTAHAAQQSNGDEPIELVMPRVMRDMTTIFADARRVNTISERDLHSRIKANALAPPDERKEPFMSEAELIEAMQETRRATELYEQLLKSLDKLSVFKTRSALRQSARQAAKAAKHHCSHCKGKAVRCGCTHDCPRKDVCKCLPRHCQHCNGASGKCKCDEGCERGDSVECRPMTSAAASKSTAKKTVKVAKPKVEKIEEDAVEEDEEKNEEEEDA
jgi:hypothetical protein